MRNVIATVAAVVVLAVIAGAAFIYSGAFYIGADHPHWSITTWLLNQARDRSIRVHASGIAVPAGLDDPTQVAVGVLHYADHCAVCHGAPGIERGEIANGLYPRPPDLADSARLYTPGELFWIVKHGIRMTGMPAWGDHTDDELWATVALFRRFPRMTADDYAKLVATTRVQGGRRDDVPAPQPAPAPQPVKRDHQHPPGHPH